MSGTLFKDTGSLPLTSFFSSPSLLPPTILYLPSLFFPRTLPFSCHTSWGYPIISQVFLTTPPMMGPLDSSCSYHFGSPLAQPPGASALTPFDGLSERPGVPTPLQARAPPSSASSLTFLIPHLSSESTSVLSSSSPWDVPKAPVVCGPLLFPHGSFPISLWQSLNSLFSDLFSPSVHDHCISQLTQKFQALV